MDRDRVWAFLERFVELGSGATTIGLMAVADRCGLLRAMAGQEPATREELAATAGLEGRYVTEILSGLAAAGVIDFEAGSERFSLPAEHAAVLADDASPYSMTGWLDILPSILAHIPAVAEAARTGGGVAFDRFDERAVEGIDRSNGPGLRILLARRWLAAMPDVVERLEAGGRIADVGCGSGTAVLTMAEAYPAAAVVGLDRDERSIERARLKAGEVGLSNVTLEAADAADLMGYGPFDLVTALDVVHDLSRPREVLTRIREALAPEGVLFMMEPNLSSHLEDNLHPKGALFYGLSTLFCMTQSLAEGGPGLGPAWGPVRAEELCRQAGFTRFQRLPIDNPFSAFYRVES